MSDVDNQNPEDGQQPSSENDNTASEESLNFRRLREKVEKLESENEQLKGVARVAAFKEAGIEVESGVGKAVYQLYDGPVEPDAIKDFAQEYGWEPKKQQAQTSPQQQRVNTIMGLGEAPEPNDTAAQIDEAESQGDWVTAQALKDAELRKIAQGKFGY